MREGTATSQPGISPAGLYRGESWDEWLDRHSRTFFIAPAVTLILLYVVVGCSIQFVIGLMLAFLCSQPVIGKNFFRVLFFIPLMITPLGVGYAFKMILDVTKGPFQPFWQLVGLGNWAWSTDAWAA